MFKFRQIARPKMCQDVTTSNRANQVGDEKYEMKNTTKMKKKKQQYKSSNSDKSPDRKCVGT